MTDRDALAEQIALTLATVKAYDLPAAVEAMGLPGDEPEEAGRSKRLYVLKRLKSLEMPDLRALGERVWNRYESATLREQLDILDDQTQPTLSSITRVKILEDLASHGAIEGKRELIGFLSEIWPINSMPVAGHQFLTYTSLGDEIWQHMVRNPMDWSYAYLFELLQIATVSQRRFSQFLELCVHPLTRDGDEQEKLVAMLNLRLRIDGFALEVAEEISGYPLYRMRHLTGGVAGRVKNLIFAANGPKPDLILADAVSNDVTIVRNAEHCLIYDRPIPSGGLLWFDLVTWWAERGGLDDPDLATERALYSRLDLSLASPPERLLFRHYFGVWRQRLERRLPALVPQVYLHYDPLTVRQRARGNSLPRQRMDFLLLFSSRERVVVEIDGKQHYAAGDIASPVRYAAMASADRELRLAGYEMYRFGGHEIMSVDGPKRIEEFFQRLFERHRVS